jgi:hypothetical protein
MKKLLLSSSLLLLFGFSSIAQLQDRNWMLGGSFGITSVNGNTLTSPSVFLGKVLSEQTVLGAGLSFQLNATDGETFFRNQLYTVEFQSYKNVSEQLPLSFFYAPSLFAQTIDTENVSIGGGFRIGLSYRPLDNWLFQITPAQIRAQFGEPDVLTITAGSSVINIVWLFGKD